MTKNMNTRIAADEYETIRQDGNEFAHNGLIGGTFEMLILGKTI